MSDDLRDAMRNERNMDLYLEARSGSEIISDIRSVMAPSLSLRDYFAAAALTGLIAHVPADRVAALSYRAADAMITSRATGEA